MSLTTTQRLIAFVASAVLLVQVVGFGLQYTLVKRDLNHRQAELLLADMAGFAALYEQRRIIAVRQAIEFRMISGGDDGILVSLQDRDGNPLAGNIDPWPRAAKRPPEGRTGPLFGFSLNGRDYVGVVRNLRGRFPLLVARDTAPNAATLARLRHLGALSLVAVIGVSIVIGWLASRVVTGRLRRINTLCERVAAGEVSARLPPPAVADEYALLEGHIHNMLDRIETLNRATHHLSDTIAHELRTPLTRIQNRLSALDANNPKVRDAIGELHTTIRIFESLLQIARAEAGGSHELDLAPLNLTALTQDMADLYAPLIEDRDMQFTAQIDEGIEILGDRNLVAQLISNLLDNALKFCPDGARISLALTACKDRHLFTLRDTGPGLPPGFENDLFERFSRADTGQAGHGLGMALVRAIALRHGAKVTLPPTDKGFAIQILWPTLRTKP